MAIKPDYDFCGWVTKNDLECADGRVIRKNAFAAQDGEKVPMLWNHNHDDPSCVLGYTVLENRPEGVYGYTYLNDTDRAKDAKLMVEHGDIDAYSIYANKLEQTRGNVYGGSIKEVSLVISGANPGATIEEVVLSHSEIMELPEGEAIINVGDSDMKFNDKLSHSDEAEKEQDETIQDILDTLDEKQLEAVQIVIGAAMQQTRDEVLASIAESDDAEEDDSEEYEDEDEEVDEDEEKYAVAHGDDEGETFMKYNTFDSATQGNFLSHADMESIINTAKKSGSLKDAASDFLAHAEDEHGIEYATDVQAYGVNDPSFLFPDARAVNKTPDWIKRDMDWVAVVMNGTKHTPFSRVKSLYADITADEARAKGYIKGNQKEEEVITLLKRSTSPQTIYKKQKLDRDDIIDITDFDIVAWIRGEMRMMLEEEIARAVLIGDGRSSASNDKIAEDHIRPIYTDAALYTIRKGVSGSSAADKAKSMISDAVRARKDYKGSGNPTLFTTEEWLTEMLLLEDTIGHRLYKTEQELATAMRVSKIVTVPVMENIKSKDNKALYGIIVNLADYNIGADKGGAVELFDDFDIDFNQYKYLIETRCSGALVKPYSAIVLEEAAANGVG